MPEYTVDTVYTSKCSTVIIPTQRADQYSSGNDPALGPDMRYWDNSGDIKHAVIYTVILWLLNPDNVMPFNK